MKLHDRFPKFRLPLWGTLLSAVLLAGAITLLALWCQPNALRSVLAVFRSQPLLIVLNCLPVGMLVLVFTCLFRNVFFSAALVNLGVCVLSIANRIKIEVRDEPVFPRDFALLKEVGSAVGTYDIQFPVSAIAVVVLFSLALAALGLFVGSRPFPVKRLRGWLGSLLGAVASFAVLVGLIFTVYASNDLYNSFAVSNAYYIPSVFNELGFPYCFCRQFTTWPVDRPEGFDRAEAAAWDEGGGTGLGKDVHVIMVMDEAFSDITDHDAFAYTAENDPLPNLHALREDPHAVTGHVLVPGFAGGTANTEFDVLTGMQTNALSAATTSCSATTGMPPPSSTPEMTGSTTGRTCTAGLGRRRRCSPIRWRIWNTRAAGSRTTTWPASSSGSLRRPSPPGRRCSTTPPPSRTTCPTPRTSTARAMTTRRCP